jgi:sarcosine oxidase delta subunit
MGRHEAISRGAERTFTRQQMLSEITIRPTLKQSLSDKTHKSRIIEYYCKALHSLLDVPEGAERVELLAYGDAKIVREHREAYKTLKAWTDYESIKGVDNVEQWLKHKGVLRPASAERSAIADDLRNRMEIQAKRSRKRASDLKRAADKKANGKR